MLVSCAAYLDGRKVADLDVDRIPDYLRRPNCFVWLVAHTADIRPSCRHELRYLRERPHVSIMVTA